MRRLFRPGTVVTGLKGSQANGMLRRLLALLLLLSASGGAGYAVWRMLQVEPPLAKATALIAAGDLFQAQVILRGVIKSEPRNVQAHLMLARTQLETDDWISAEKESKTLRTLGYDRTVVAPMLTLAYAKQGKYQDILADISATTARPDEKYVNLALRSVAFLGMNDVGLAQQQVDAAAKLAPDAFLVHLQKARIALARNNIDLGLREIDQALTQQPESVEALVTKADLLESQSDKVGAIEQLNIAVGVAPLDQDLRMKRAELLVSINSNKAAQADVDKVFSITPTNATALYYNAVLMFRAGQIADANVEFDKLGTLMDQFPTAYYYKAQIALALGNTQSALESLDRLLKFRPTDPDGIRLTAYVQLNEGQPERAIAELLPVTAPGSRDAGAIDLLGRAYFMLGQMPEAVSNYRRATSIAPDSKEFSAHLTAAQVQFGMTPIPGADGIELAP